MNAQFLTTYLSLPFIHLPGLILCNDLMGPGYRASALGIAVYVVQHRMNHNH
jgi:hypothetical protein